MKKKQQKIGLIVIVVIALAILGVLVIKNMSSKKTAETAKEILESTGQLSESKEKGTVEFYSSADQEKFTSSGNIILGESVTIVETKEI